MLEQAYKPRPNAVTIEPQAGPWKNNPAWGDRFRGPMPLEAGIQTQTFSGEQMPGPPRVQSVQLFRDDRPVSQNCDFRAHVFYGIGAVQNEFFVDWLHGCQFSLVCNWVRVVAVTYAPNPAIPYVGDDAQIEIAATVAEGAVSKGLPATFTESKEGSNPTAVSFESPDFAKRVILWGNNAGAAGTVQFIGGGSFEPFVGTVASWTTTIQALGGLPLPGGVRRVIWAPSGANEVLTVQWVLGL